MLQQPSHPGNIGAAARALAVMGFGELRCVAPRLPGWKKHPEAIARASHALRVLDAARQDARLEDAIADCHLVVAVSAEVRDFGPDLLGISDAAAIALQRLQAQANLRVGWLFGSEQHGLSRQQAAKAHLLACIPGQPEYHSLNLAQAVLLVAWEMRNAILNIQPPAQCGQTEDDRPGARMRRDPLRLASPPDGEAADAQAVESLIAHLEAAALLVGFLDPKHPKMLMARLRRLLMRCELRKEEVDLLRGLLRAIERPRRRGAATTFQG